MPIQVNSDTYLTKDEAKEMLGGISDQTLRTLARKHGVRRYNRDIAPNIKFYRKEDIEKLIQMRPVEDEKEEGDGA
jgi:hypothetical protein